MKKTQMEGFVRIEQEGGRRLSCTEDMPLIEKDGFFFKDMERTGELLPYAKPRFR